MFDQLVSQVATRGWRLVVRAATSPGPQAAAKRYALQVGAAVTAMGAKKAADMAEDKIEELADRGNLSPKAAAVASGVVRAASFGITITAAAVGTAAGSMLDGNEPMRLIEAVRGTARNPANGVASLPREADSSGEPTV